MSETLREIYLGLVFIVTLALVAAFVACGIRAVFAAIEWSTTPDAAAAPLLKSLLIWGATHLVLCGWSAYLRRARP